MTTKKFQLDQSAIDQLSRLNASISHQSIQFSMANLQLDEMKNGIRGLYNARQQVLNKYIKDNNITPELVETMDIDDNGVVTINFKENLVAPNGTADTQS